MKSSLEKAVCAFKLYVEKVNVAKWLTCERRTVEK